MSYFKHRLRKAQSTVEYIIVVTGVIATMIVLLNPDHYTMRRGILVKGNGLNAEEGSPFRKGMIVTLNHLAIGMEKQSVTLAVTRPAG